MAKNKSLMDEIAALPSESSGSVLKKENERLRGIIDLMQASLDRKATARFKLNIGRKGKTKKGAFCRVIIPDTHGCWVDKPAIAAVLKDLERINPAEIVLMGDHLDCSGWLAAHHPFQTVQEAKYSFESSAS